MGNNDTVNIKSSDMRVPLILHSSSEEKKCDIPFEAEVITECSPEEVKLEMERTTEGSTIEAEENNRSDGSTLSQKPELIDVTPMKNENTMHLKYSVKGDDKTRKN